jgi:hypothetical protein
MCIGLRFWRNFSQTHLVTLTKSSSAGWQNKLTLIWSFQSIFKECRKSRWNVWMMCESGLQTTYKLLLYIYQKQNVYIPRTKIQCYTYVEEKHSCCVCSNSKEELAHFFRKMLWWLLWAVLIFSWTFYKLYPCAQQGCQIILGMTSHNGGKYT